MKTTRLFVVFFTIAVLAGCASTGHNDTVTGAVAGGLIGGAIGGSTGAVKGGLLGAGIGVLMDSQEKKDDQRAEKARELIYNQTGGGDSAAAEARLKAQRNLAFAEKKRRECEAEFGAYKEAGENWPHNCQQVRKEAFAAAKYVSDTNSPEVFYETMRGGTYGGYRNGVNVQNANWWCNFRRRNGNPDCRDLY